MGVALTTRSDCATCAASTVGHRPAGRSGQCGHGTGAVRCPVDHGHLGGAGSARACITARAAPPAPITRQRLPGRVEAGGPRQRGHEALAVGVGAEQRPALVDDAVDRRSRRATSVQLVDQGRHVGLVRHGDRQPGDAEGAHAVERGRPARARTSKANERHPVETRARRRRRCGAGARVSGAIGLPMTPTTVVSGIRWPGGLRRHGHGSAQGSPRAWASCSLASCSAKVSAKASVPFFWTSDEVQPPARRRMQGGRQRDGRRHADRCRRETGVEVRVVGDWIFRSWDVTGPPSWPRAYSTVESICSGVLVGQSVVDDPGHLGHVLGVVALLLHDGGHGDDLVGRETQRRGRARAQPGRRGLAVEALHHVGQDRRCRSPRGGPGSPGAEQPFEIVRAGRREGRVHGAAGGGLRELAGGVAGQAVRPGWPPRTA